MAKLSMGEFLSVLRKAKGLTQESVAEQLGVSAKSVSSWENSRTYPDVLLLPAIAELYGVTVDELVRGERTLQEEPSERMKEVSQDSMRKIRKRKYASFLEKRIVYSAISVVSALVSVLGCFLMSFVAFWTVVFAILGLIGTMTGVILSAINKKKYLAGEGIVLPDDMTEETRPMVLTVGIKNLLSVILSAILYFVYGASIMIVRLLNPNAFIYRVGSQIDSLAIDSTGLVLTVGGIALLLGFGMLVYTIVYRILILRKFGTEEQKCNQKKNVKLTVILMSIAVGILILVELVVGVSSLVNSDKQTGYDGELFDNFEDFKDYLQTVPANHLLDEHNNSVVSEIVLNIPSEMISLHTDRNDNRYFEFVPGEYDCGNSFFIKVYNVDTKYTVEDAIIHYPAFLICRRGGIDYQLYEISECLMTLNHPNADGTSTVSEPVVNVRYADYLSSNTNKNETNTVVKVVNSYSSFSEEPTSKEFYIAEYMDSGDYKGKYGIFVYYKRCKGWGLLSLSIWLSIMRVYLIFAVILCAVKYKKQKFGFEI